MFETLLAFLTDNATVLGGLAAILAVIETVFAPFRGLARSWRKPERVQIANPEAITQIAAAPAMGTMILNLDDFTALQRQLREEARADLATAHGTEHQQLQDRIDALSARLANPDEALAQQQAVILDLKSKLARQGNTIGGDDILAAKAALDKGDFSAALGLFETLAARTQPDVQTQAEATFALGQIAEAEVRWHDAATHFATAARLTPGFDTLHKAHEYAWRAGDYPAAHYFGADLLAWAKSQGAQEQLAAALNGHAITLNALGQYAEAEALFRQALDVDAATIGTAHPRYATHLNNLASVVQAQGRWPEARDLYLQAIPILQARLGDQHPDTMAGAKNLLSLLLSHFPDDPEIPALQTLVAAMP